CDRTSKGCDRGEEILHVAADGRSGVLLEVLLRLVFGELLELVRHVLVDGRAAAGRGEVVAHDTRAEGALVAVEGRAPGVGRIRGAAPAPMVPDDLQASEVEG